MLKDFNTSGLSLFMSVWVVVFGKRQYGPYFEEDEALNAAKELLSKMEILTNQQVEVYTYRVEKEHQYSIRINQTPEFEISTDDLYEPWIPLLN